MSINYEQNRNPHHEPNKKPFLNKSDTDVFLNSEFNCQQYLYSPWATISIGTVDAFPGFVGIVTKNPSAFSCIVISKTTAIWLHEQLEVLRKLIAGETIGAHIYSQLPGREKNEHLKIVASRTFTYGLMSLEVFRSGSLFIVIHNFDGSTTHVELFTVAQLDWTSDCLADAVDEDFDFEAMVQYVFVPSDQSDFDPPLWTAPTETVHLLPPPDSALIKQICELEKLNEDSRWN